MSSSTKTAENGKLTAEEMRQALALEKQAREQACLADINAALKKHKCRLDAIPGITPDGRIMAQFMVTANE